jgi:hypothetical protein
VWTTADSNTAAAILNGRIRYLCPTQLIPYPCQTIGQPSPAQIRLALTEGGAQANINPIPVSYADLGSLPGNPVTLDRYFGSLFHVPAVPAALSEFQTIYDLLISYVMPPALTAELYHALGDLPGVTVNDHAVDAAGRTGIGFQISIHRTPYMYPSDQLILDPSTYQLMGYSTEFIVPAVFSSGHTGPGLRAKGLSTAVLKSSLVSGPGVVP